VDAKCSEVSARITRSDRTIKVASVPKSKADPAPRDMRICDNAALTRPDHAGAAALCRISEDNADSDRNAYLKQAREALISSRRRKDSILLFSPITWDAGQEFLQRQVGSVFSR
jgi:hypothetical protein